MTSYSLKENHIRWPVQERSFVGATLFEINFFLTSTIKLKESPDFADRYTADLYNAAVFLATQAKGDDADKAERQTFCLSVIETLMENGVFPVLRKNGVSLWTPLKKIATIADREEIVDSDFFLEIAEKLHHAGAPLPPYSFCKDLRNEKLRLWFLERCALQEKTNILLSIEETGSIAKDSVVKKKRFF